MTDSAQNERDATASADARRRNVVDRRGGVQFPIAFPDRRNAEGRRDGVDRRDPTGLKRLRGPGRRRPEFNRSAEEGEFTDEQFLFVAAIDAFKRANNKSFPTWTEVLEVIRRLGYRKTSACELNLPNIVDWVEEPDAPAFVEPTEPCDDDE